MKKTLAILLALLMVGSIVFVACDGSGRTPVGDGFDDDGDNDYIDESEEDNSESTNATESESQQQTGNDNYGWVDKNDTVYAGYSMNLYENSSTTAGVIYDGIKVGDALSRISSNGTFDKVSVTVNGETKTGYVQSKWVSTINNFTFNPIDPEKDLTVKATDNKKLSIFTTPHIVMNGSDYDYHNIVLKGGLTAAAFSEGYSLKAVGENTNWIKVELVGTITLSNNSKSGTADEPLVLYIYKNHVEGRVDGLGSVGGNDNV